MRCFAASCLAIDGVKRNMTDLAKARKLLYVTVDILPLRSLLLALFLVSGVICGYVSAGRCGAGMAEELRRYLTGYLSAASERTPTAAAAVRTLVCYLRAPLVSFLLGFASIGVVALPLLFAVQGFVLSFSLFSFALALGRESFLLLPTVFAIRLLFVLPCTFFWVQRRLRRRTRWPRLRSAVGNGFVRFRIQRRIGTGLRCVVCVCCSVVRWRCGLCRCSLPHSRYFKEKGRGDVFLGRVVRALSGLSDQ